MRNIHNWKPLNLTPYEPNNEAIPIAKWSQAVCGQRIKSHSFIDRSTKASVSIGDRSMRTHRAAMISLGVLLTIVCAAQSIGFNDTKLTEQLLKRIVPLPDSPGKPEVKRPSLINNTASALGIDTDAIAKLAAQVKSFSSQAGRIADFSYITNAVSPGVGNPVLKSIEESPDYASSVVLASDLLSLTTAVGNVKERACREQGTKFLDGLLQNKRWALKS